VTKDNSSYKNQFLPQKLKTSWRYFSVNKGKSFKTMERVIFKEIMESMGLKITTQLATEAFLEFKGPKLENSTSFDTQKLCNWLVNNLDQLAL
jgi:hypothetical protein